MKELKGMCLSDCQPPSTIREKDLFEDFSRSYKNDHRKQEKKLLTINKDLADDHLTATYWG